MEQVLWETILKDAFPDLLLVNRETLVSKVEIGLHLGHSNNKAIQFKISFDRRKRKKPQLKIWGEQTQVFMGN